ncbi:hypothetical protein K505DRAFT_365962 [Melanomma pulvis-pyrius CBS 109.77]|uniref:Uncharacterized protein n=1 Tax=Melanomma pulvis-pyrius CBS 109.77 TaxID=1314802 RepID=A0A6A6WXT9_9PLEO|nr:hypothetical protein K505DRAFT_365962 [Melanomma pulvis-pyrius CBS 109.77]
MSSQPTLTFLDLCPEVRFQIYKIIAADFRSSSFKYRGIFLSCRQIKFELEFECIQEFNKFIESIKEVWQLLPLQPLRISHYPITQISQRTRLRINVSSLALIFMYNAMKANTIGASHGNLSYSNLDYQRMMAFLRLLVYGLEAFVISVDARDALGVSFEIILWILRHLELSRTSLR